MRTLPIRIGTTILDEIEKVYEDITQSVYEKYLESRSAYTLDIEDWLAAERQMLSKPEVQVVEKDDVFAVKIALDFVDPSTVDILATCEDVLIQSNPASDQPRLFRAVHFPLPINPLQLHGTYVEGHLLLIAPKNLAVSR